MSQKSFVRKNSIFFILIFLFFTGLVDVNSQEIVNTQKTQEEIFLARTKQFNEFVDRFNYKTDFRGNPVDKAFEAKMPREKMISLLFDLKDPRSISDNDIVREKYLNIRSEFISDVRRKDLLINKHSSGIIAEARTRVIYKGQPGSVSLFLNQERVGNGSLKWVLLTARGEIFDIFKKDTMMIRFIPPASNETDFINLKRAMEDTDHLPDYASKHFETDHLTLFFYCIKTGSLRYEYVENVVYHITDIPGWYIRVKDFNRNELNSGWLITDVEMGNLDLDDLLKRL
jgi:hypothetical protein